jgi:replicative DNA helicase
MRATPFDKQLAADADAERAVLGAVMLACEDAGGMVAEVEAAGGPRLFAHDTQRAVWEAFLAVHGRGLQINPLTVQAELQRAGKLDLVGGMAGVAALIDGVPRYSDVGPYVALLSNAAKLRQAAHLGNWLLNAALDGERFGEELLLDARARLDALTGDGADAGLLSSGEVFDATLAYLEGVWAGDIRRVLTGFPDLDRLIVGLEPGDLILLAGLRGSGKSALALNVAYHVLRGDGGGRVALLATLEMSTRMLAQRALAAFSRVPLGLIRSGFLRPEEREAVREAAQVLRRMPLEFVEPERDFGLDALWQKAVRTRRRHSRLDFVVVDYLQLLHAERGQSKAERVSSLSAGLKRLALSLGVPLLCLAGMNRDAEREGREPRLSDLDYGGEKDADHVWMLHDPHDRDMPQRRQLFVRKNRNGEEGTVELGFSGKRVMFFSTTEG